MRAGELREHGRPRSTERLAALTEAGVSVWLDQIRRSLVEGGELARMVAEECLRGVTANPSIFEKAILGSDDYDEDLAAMAREQLDAQAIYDRLADPRRAARGRRARRRPPRDRAAETDSSRSRSRRTSPTTRSARSPPRGATGRRWTGRT